MLFCVCLCGFSSFELQLSALFMILNGYVELREKWMVFSFIDLNSNS